MKKRFALLLMAAMAAGSTGCVAQREADDLRTLYRKSQEQIIDLQAQLEEANARIAALQAAQANPAELQALMAERDRLRDALADAEARLREAGQQEVVLPADLDAALRELAAQYPDLMEYDPALGMVKFRSDLTFPLGSAEVGPEARTTLNRLAEVLRSGVAQGYDVRVVGHTDAVPVSNPATKARHPNNWYLSAHRAISVRDVLEQAGVQPNRLGVAGYGQYRPVVPNGPRGAAEENRRVEIYLLESPVGQFGGAGMTLSPNTETSNTSPAAEQTTEAPTPQAPEMYK